MLYEVRRDHRAAAGLPVLRLSADLGWRGEKGQKISTDNRVLFHRVANTLIISNIKTVGGVLRTCMDSTAHYEFDKIFPGWRLLDIHEYLLEKDVKLGRCHRRALHVPDPCHTPMKTYQPMQVVNQLMGSEVN